MDTKSRRSAFLMHVVIAITIVLTLFLAAMRYDRFGGPWLFVFLQGLPTLVMLAIVASRSTTETPRYHWAIVAALAWSLLGGYCLVFPKQQQFLLGVAAFFCANLCYLTAFTTGVRFARRIAPFLIVGLTGATVLVIAWPYIPSHLKLPLLLYALSIISVSAQSFTRGLVTRRRMAMLAALGATLLLTSDSMIAVSRFYSKFWLDAFLVATTYFVGQWLIATSIIGAGKDD
jgi:uncharacterized membrane protein YhhN